MRVERFADDVTWYLDRGERQIRQVAAAVGVPNTSSTSDVLEGVAALLEAARDQEAKSNVIAAVVGQLKAAAVAEWTHDVLGHALAVKEAVVELAAYYHGEPPRYDEEWEGEEQAFPAAGDAGDVMEALRARLAGAEIATEIGVLKNTPILQPLRSFVWKLERATTLGDMGDLLTELFGEVPVQWKQRWALDLLGVRLFPEEATDELMAFYFSAELDRRHLHSGPELAQAPEPTRPFSTERIETGCRWSPILAPLLADFSPRSLGRLGWNQVRRETIVSAYKRDAERYVKTVVYACGVDELEHFTGAFVDAGVRAEAFHPALPAAERFAALARFHRAPREMWSTDVLVCPASLAYGVEARVATVFLARPTANPDVWAHMVEPARRGAGSGRVVEFVDDLLAHGDALVTAPAR